MTPVHFLVNRARLLLLVVLLGWFGDLPVPADQPGPGVLPTLTIETGTSTSRIIQLSGRDAWYQLIVTGQDASGQKRDVTRQVTYAVTPADVARVDETGLMTPLGEGQATLRVTKAGAAPVTLKVTVTDLRQPAPINFANQIVPTFTRLGCNSGGCHGKSGGQNGFALSLFGFEPAEDYDFLVKEARGRRLFLAAPKNSLLLTKATGSVAHGGGKRLSLDSTSYRLLHRWIEQGAPYGRKNDPTVSRIEVVPHQRVLERTGQQQLGVLALLHGWLRPRRDSPGPVRGQ